MTIRVGDLVMVVGAHCDGFAREADGVIYTVGGIFQGKITCNHCGQFMEAATSAHEGKKGGWNIPVPYLKRIPPLDELEKGWTYQPEPKTWKVDA